MNIATGKPNRIGLIFFVCLVCATPSALHGQEPSVTRQVPWTTSNVKGSPDPPLPYRTTRVFTDLGLQRPTTVVWLPDANRWIATQQNGQIVAFEDDPQNAVAEPLFHLSDTYEGEVYQALAIHFHPDQKNEPWCFITYKSTAKDSLGTHLARLRVIDPTVPTVDTSSLVVMASWSSFGHMGGSMQFGSDGMFYVYGDWMTGKVWALKHEEDRILWQKELVDTPLQVICFMIDATGEVMIVGYDGTVMRLDTNTQPADARPFPVRLSETGVFSDVVAQQPAEGVVEYEISAHHWADGTHSRQWIAVPETGQLQLIRKSDWKIGDIEGQFDYPPDTVFAKTVSYRSDEADPNSERRLETQLLHLLGDEWSAYNYIWNDEQTDALLQADTATERKLEFKDDRYPDGLRTQTWRHASRSECKLCHIWAAGTIHGFQPEQLNIDYNGEGQLDSLRKLGLFQTEVPEKSPVSSPYDESRSLEVRARSWLDLNCSSCHRLTGGGSATTFNFDRSMSLQENEYLDAPPTQGAFDIPNARIVAPGDPTRSVLMFRTLKSGRGHMPQFGSHVIDHEGLRLLRDWIASMPSDTPVHADWNSQLAALTEADNPDEQIKQMLQATSSAIALSLGCNATTTDAALRDRIVKLGAGDPRPRIRDLFEHFLPEDQRVKRLGPTIDEAALLAMEGSAERGRILFETAQDVNCRACHQLGTVGKKIGPDLSGIGTLRTPAEVLASIVRPSEKIERKYRLRQIVTVKGLVVSGLVIEESEKQIVVADANGKTQTILAADIEDMFPVSVSVMPERLLAGLTAEQAADLLAFLMAQRKINGPQQHRSTTIHRTHQAIVIDGKRDESAWQKSAPVDDFVFTWQNAGDGGGQQQKTDVRALWDDDNLYVSFQVHDKNILSTRVGRDSEVYRDDCVEVFASPEPEHPENYFNIEMNAGGSILDAYRRSGEADPDWSPEGIRCAVTANGTLNDSSDIDTGWIVELVIPFHLFGHVLPEGRPTPGDRWRMNFNRLDDSFPVSRTLSQSDPKAKKRTRIKSQWSQSDRNNYRFHTPDFFGFVEFAE